MDIGKKVLALARGAMPSRKEALIAFAAGAAAAGVALYTGVVKAAEYKAEGFAVPDVKSATYLGKGNSDSISEIPGAETIQKGYRARDGTIFNSLSFIDKNGQERIYGYYVDTDGKMPMEYTLFDSTGKGIFDVKTTTPMPTDKWILDAYK